MKLTSQQLAQSLDYTTYRNVIDQLWKEGKSTGPIQNEELLHYTELNIHRMNRVEKTTVLAEELISVLEALKQPQIWLVLTEGWCGDGAQIVPIFNVIEKAFPIIKFRLLLRDENLELMDQYLTKGSRSIPKLLILDAVSFEVLAQWGPQPQEATDLINTMKAENKEKAEIKEKLHLWYAKNRGKAVQSELINCLKNIK